jgi:LuxR family transcriptional regulator, maltose regulon positive regulatory protein
VLPKSTASAATAGTAADGVPLWTTPGPRGPHELGVAGPSGPSSPWSAERTFEPPDAAGVVRPRLLHALDEVLARRLAVVVAPAGWGKTTLVAQWAARQARPVAWCRPAQRRPGAGGLAALLGDAVQAVRTGRNQPVVVVLDDVQELGGTPDRAELEALLGSAPPGVSVVLSSRTAPHLELARAELPSPVRLTADDLRLRPHELLAAAHRTHGLTLDADEALDVTQVTDGWPAALTLFCSAPEHASAAGRRRAPRVDRGVPWAAGYLERQVLAHVPPDVRRLLREASSRDGLTRRDAEVVLGRPCAAVLAGLVAAGLLRRDDADPAVHRVPEPLGRHLLGELVEQDGPPRPPDGIVGRCPDLPEPVEEAADGPVHALLRGDRSTAQRLAGEDRATLTLGERLAESAVAALVDRSATALTEAAELHRLAQRADQSAVARLAAGVAAAGDPDGGAFARSLAEAADRRGEAGTSALLLGVALLGDLRRGRADLDAIDDLVRRCRALSWGRLEAWARAASALAGARQHLPDAAVAADAAAAFARRADVPGALAVCYAALAGARPAHASDLLLLAESTARTSGLGCAPWTWTSAGDAGVEPVPPSTSAPRAALARRVDVRCLGPFALHVDGVPVDLSLVRPRARTVLRVLAVSAGRPVHAEHLVGLLWADLPQSAALHNLQVAVSSLRQVLEPEVPGRSSRVLVRQGGAYQLVLGPGGSTDLLRFAAVLAEAAGAGEDATAEQALVYGLALYGGDLLPEEGTADWVVEARDRYRLQAAEAAAMLARVRLRAGAASSAAAAAKRSLELDRWSDASWRLLVEALTQAGDLAAAARARQAYSSVLAALGLPLPPGVNGAPGTPARPAPPDRRAAVPRPRGR